MKGTAWHPKRLLSSLPHRLSLGGNRKASLENTPGLPTRRENYFWIEVLAHCNLWQNSHWSQHSQDSPLSQQFWVPAHSALELPAGTIRVWTVPRAFVLCTAGRSHETPHISKQVLSKQLGNLRHCSTARDSDLYAEAWCFTLAHHSKTNLILTNFLSFTKTCL